MSGLSGNARERLLYLISPIGLIVVWQALLMLGIGDRRFIPAPSDIAQRFIKLTADGELEWHTAVTLYRVFLGYVIGAVPAVAVGLLMDEPFAALDAQNRTILQAELVRIWEQTRKTVVYITHSIEEALLLGDRTVVMTAQPGRIKQVIDVPFARPRDVLALAASAEFGALKLDIWRVLEQEVTRARAEMER